MAKWRQVDVSVLLAHPTTEILVPAPPDEESPAAVLSGLDDDRDDELTRRFRHVQEVLTGYQLGDEVLALPGEPRPDYGPGAGWMHRYAAKAAELGVAESTIRNWARQVRNSGPAGLVHERPKPSVLNRADHRWLDMARAVLAEHKRASRPVRNLILIEIEERLTKEHGKGTVPVPARTTGYELLGALAKGTNAFEGSTKGKRSIADATKGTYGRLRATRPGEYVVLDTNCLDVFAMEPVTCRWVRCELTVAMDLYSRCITGLRLTPVSTQSVDVAGVLFETVRPRDVPEDGSEPLPFLPPGSPVKKAQEEFNAEVLRIEAPREVAAQRGRELAMLAHAALLSLRSTLSSAPDVVHTVLEECGGGLPDAQYHHGGSDAHNAAIGTAIANIALHRERDDSDAVLSWLMSTDRLRRRSAHPTPWLANWAPAGPGVTSRALAVVARELTWIARLRYGAATATPAWPTLTDQDVQRRAARLPAMLWPAWTMRLLPRLPKPVVRLAGLRRACATLLLIPGTFCEYHQAAQLLGNPRAYDNREALDTSLDKQRPNELAAFLVL
ncbi:helix-turn-helix domain containing protein [Streptomyces sp. NBC_01283]|uniref:helix-turn-helix domain-containing protein n=1 Tax=Streptomyces sp. NBC_01283 TaxID=2903812 RepID=UPI00352F191A|nr:helix-turn-helix domain containing protein [Streptomyces sp. NBC_01283]